jgi:hypothetical protein
VIVASPRKVIFVLPFAVFMRIRAREQRCRIIEKITYFLIKIILDLIHKRTLD